MAARFEIKKTANGQFQFTLNAGNGETVLTSEIYKAKAGAENGVQSVKKNATDDSRYERKTSSSKKPYFVLKAANHEVIGTSQMYSNEAAMEGGIESVKQNASAAGIEDLT